MPPAPEDLHLSRVDERSYEVVEVVLRWLNQRIPYVLAGGWAAFAYGTRVPSADTDVLIERALAKKVYEMVETELGVTTGPGERFEILDIDRFNRILGPDPELGEPDRGYVPADLLRGRTRAAEVRLPKTTLNAIVPEPAAFAFTKLKAYHDLEFAYRALRDPAVMATIPPADRGEIHEKVDSYYAAKAGKDLFDVAYMLANHTTLDEVGALADEHDLRQDLEPPLLRPDPYVRRIAMGLAKPHDSTRAWLDGIAR